VAWPYCNEVTRSIFLVKSCTPDAWGTKRCVESAECSEIFAPPNFPERPSISFGRFEVGSNRLGRAVAASRVSNGK